MEIWKFGNFKHLIVLLVFLFCGNYIKSQTCSSPFICGTPCSNGQVAELKVNGQGGQVTFAKFDYCNGIFFYKSISSSGSFTTSGNISVTGSGKFIGNGSGLTSASGWNLTSGKINTNSYVGIGLSNPPSSQLEVGGTIKATNFYCSGNVGIGTAIPTAKLTVKGKILAEEFEIVTNVAADYVFENSYKLRSLNEVEQFIKQNKHLPDVPGAAEQKEKGYKMAEMDNTLLRKVEELTLYTIELNKQVEALKEELAKVKGGE